MTAKGEYKTSASHFSKPYPLCSNIFFRGNDNEPFRYLLLTARILQKKNTDNFYVDKDRIKVSEITVIITRVILKGENMVEYSDIFCNAERR